MTRVILLGPSLDLPPARKRAWVNALARKLKLGKSDFLVAVDGGVQTCALISPKTVPQIAVGDWDSADYGTLKRFENAGTLLLSLPKRKDASDLHFALRAISGLQTESGFHSISELLLIGFTGGRPDHHLANLFEIGSFVTAHGSEKTFRKIAAIGPEAEYHFITGRQPSFRVGQRAGTLISVFSIGFSDGGVSRGVSMKGFEYNLHDAKLSSSSESSEGSRSSGGSRGLSNTVRRRGAEIGVKQGTLVVVIPNIPTASNGKLKDGS